MAIVLLNGNEGELSSNYAEFANDAVEDSNLGTLYWDTPTFNENTQEWDVTGIHGTDVWGNELIIGILTNIPTSEKVNPTKVFWWIVSKIKSTLCPECM